MEEQKIKKTKSKSRDRARPSRNGGVRGSRPVKHQAVEGTWADAAIKVSQDGEIL